MKELYSSPELEIIRLDAEDVVACSECPTQCGSCSVDTIEVDI